MLRYVLVLVDLSHSMSTERDIVPSRILAATGALERFTRAFFDENPLSRLGLIGLRNKKAERT